MSNPTKTSKSAFVPVKPDFDPTRDVKNLQRTFRVEHERDDQMPNEVTEGCVELCRKLHTVSIVHKPYAGYSHLEVFCTYNEIGTFYETWNAIPALLPLQPANQHGERLIGVDRGATVVLRIPLSLYTTPEEQAEVDSALEDYTLLCRYEVTIAKNATHLVVVIVDTEAHLDNGDGCYYHLFDTTLGKYLLAL